MKTQLKLIEFNNMHVKLIPRSPEDVAWDVRLEILRAVAPLKIDDKRIVVQEIQMMGYPWVTYIKESIITIENITNSYILAGIDKNHKFYGRSWGSFWEYDILTKTIPYTEDE
uniref:Uncharacterized protein n=1 Tax=viral metagenome TaxID=1070528 RepID=A0A6M3JTT6_9ZZZZ